MWGNQDGFDHGQSGLLMAGMMIFWIAVIVVAIWLVIRLTDRRPSHHLGHEMHSSALAPRGEAPKDILDRRLALGEIDAEQYSIAKKLLAG
jgi:putative membrane protein